jgi:hypothetical protein
MKNLVQSQESARARNILEKIKARSITLSDFKYITKLQ